MWEYEQYCGNWRGLNWRLVKSDKHQDGSNKTGKYSPPPPCHYRLSWAWYVGFSFQWLTSIKSCIEGDFWRFNDCVNDLGLRRLHIHRAVTQGRRVWRRSVIFLPSFFSRAIHNLNPLWLVTTKEQLLILQKYFMLRSVVLLSILAVCLCVVQTKLNCQIKGREMGGNRWKLVNSESGSGPTSFTMFWIKDQTPRVSPLLDQKTTAGNQGARHPFAGRRPK